MNASFKELLQPTRCAICDREGHAEELYPARLDEEPINAHTFSARRFYDRKIHYRMARCVACGLVRSDPVLPPEELAMLYRASHFTYEGEVTNLTRTYGRYLARVRRHHADAGRFLDIGCGNGFMVEEAARQGYSEVCGVEPSEEAAAQSAPRMRANISVAMFSASLFPPASFDVITLFQTLDHLSNPRSALADCFTLLVPGGAVLLFNHNVRAMSARILGERSPIIDIEHTYLYDTNTIRQVCEVEGFAVLEVNAAWNTVSLAYLVSLLPLRNVRMKDGMTRIFERLRIARVSVRAPLGNLYCIAQKPLSV